MKQFWVFVFFLILSGLLSCSGEIKQPGIAPDRNQDAYTSLNGVYIGLEEMSWIDSSGQKEYRLDPSRPEDKWYYLSKLKIRGDSAFLDQSPVSIDPKGDTSWSSSDGGFFYNYGTVKRKDSTVYLDLIFRFCDYCGVPELKPGQNPDSSWRRKKWSGKLTSRGILINRYMFLKSSDTMRFYSEFPPSFYSENPPSP